MTTSTSDWDTAFSGPDPASDDSDRPIRIRIRRRRRKSKGNKRRDIQGLRMVAVVSVVINHLTSHPQGGFVGVDVFFVISGYLITGHLLREHGKSGRISLVDFYRRRIRRLFPAALTVIVGTMIASYIVFDSARAESVRTDGLLAAVFSANWRFISIGTNYFEANGPVSPLQHYWSLSVEEQFYVVWPFLLIVALLAARTVFRNAKHSAAVASAVVVGALCAASLWYAAATPNQVVTYFSTLSRGWELGLGALLAIFAPYMRGSRKLMSALSWAGLVLILVALFVVTPDHFPFPGALLPCIGAGLVVTASSPKGAAKNRILTNKLSTYIGDISYSVYVVHFPIIVIVGAIRPDWNVNEYLIASLLILGTSMLLYHLIENPIRQSNWLLPKRERGTSIGTEHGLRYGSLLGASAVVIGMAGVALTATGADAGLAAIRDGLGSPTPTASGSGVDQQPVAPQLAALQGRLRSALLAETWPTLDEDPGAALASDIVGCGASLANLSQCTFGTGSKAVYLVGDSTSVAYTNAFKAMVPQLPGWRVRSAGGSGCPFAATLLNTEAGNLFIGNCSQRNKDLVDEINRVRPALVVITARGGDNISQIDSQFAEYQKVRKSVGHFVVLPPNPGGKDPGDCYTSLSVPSACVAKATPRYKEELALDKVLAQRLGGTFIDPTEFFCVSDFCPEFEGHTPIRRDAVHITESFSAALGPVILEAMRQDHLFDG